MEHQQGKAQSAEYPHPGAHLPDALKGFDSLPDSANVRLPVVRALFGCSSATIWRMVKNNRLPNPRKLSERVTAWNVGELRKALAA
jgi:predicted DNA-binding transcriptional regulator AlpA